MIKIYSDGAATMTCINGEYLNGPGGWAWALIDDNNNIVKANYGGEKETTNNRMELMAILNALNTYKDKDITIYSDSAYCVNMLKDNGWIYNWKNNGWTRGKKHEPIENLDIVKSLYEHIISRNILFVKVAGHSTNELNNYVDKLAVQAKKLYM